MSSYDKQIEHLKRHAEAQGWRYLRANTGHHQFYAPNKHDIVTFAKTPGDHRGWLNSMADMKRAGYLEPNGNYRAPTLGDALAVANQSNKVVEVKRTKVTARGELSAAIREYMQSRANQTVLADDLVLAVRRRVPTTTRDSVIIQVNNLISRGAFDRLDRGSYIYRERKEAAPVAPAVEAPVTTSAPPPADTDPAPTLGKIDDALANDIAALDTALAALGEIEGVVRRTKEKIDQLIALRKALGG